MIELLQRDLQIFALLIINKHINAKSDNLALN